MGPKERRKKKTGQFQDYPTRFLPLLQSNFSPFCFNLNKPNQTKPNQQDCEHLLTSNFKVHPSFDSPTPPSASQETDQETLFSRVMKHSWIFSHSMAKNVSSLAVSENALIATLCNSIQALGRGFDVTSDIRLLYCKGAPGSRLVHIDEDQTRNLEISESYVIPNVSVDIECSKGRSSNEKTPVWSFHEVSPYLGSPVFLTPPLFCALFWVCCVGFSLISCDCYFWLW